MASTPDRCRGAGVVRVEGQNRIVAGLGFLEIPPLVLGESGLKSLFDFVVRHVVHSMGQNHAGNRMACSVVGDLEGFLFAKVRSRMDF